VINDNPVKEQRRIEEELRQQAAFSFWAEHPPEF